MNKLRISLTESGGDIKGAIQIDGDGAFVIEALAEVIKSYASKTGVAEHEILTDVWSFIWSESHGSKSST